MRRANRERANESAQRLTGSLRVVGRPSNSPPPELLSKNTLAQRSAFVNSTTVVVNSAAVLQENA